MTPSVDTGLLAIIRSMGPGRKHGRKSGRETICRSLHHAKDMEHWSSKRDESITICT